MSTTYPWAYRCWKKKHKTQRPRLSGEVASSMFYQRNLKIMIVISSQLSFWVIEVDWVINNYSSATHKLLVTMPQNEKKRKISTKGRLVVFIWNRNWADVNNAFSYEFSNLIFFLLHNRSILTPFLQQWRCMTIT